MVLALLPKLAPAPRGPRPLRTWWVPALAALALLAVGLLRTIPKEAPENGRAGWHLVQRLASDLRRAEPSVFKGFRPLNGTALGRAEPPPTRGNAAQSAEGERLIRARAPAEAQASLIAHWAIRLGDYGRARAALRALPEGTDPTTLGGLRSALVRWGHWPDETPPQ